MGGTIRQTSVEGYMEIFGAENLDKLLITIRLRDKGITMMENHRSWVILEKLHWNWIHMSFPWIKNLGLNNKSANVLGFRMEPIPDT
jgi:hypothetical protein